MIYIFQNINIPGIKRVFYQQWKLVCRVTVTLATLGAVLIRCGVHTVKVPLLMLITLNSWVLCTLYTTIPHSELKYILKEVVQFCFMTINGLAIERKTSSFVKQNTLWF